MGLAPNVQVSKHVIPTHQQKNKTQIYLIVYNHINIFNQFIRKVHHYSLHLLNQLKSFFLFFRNVAFVAWLIV